MFVTLDVGDLMLNKAKFSGFILLSFVFISAFQNCSKLKSTNLSSSVNDKVSLDNFLSSSQGSALAARGLAGNSNGSSDFGNGSISSDVLGSQLTISTTSRLAGAIGSIQFRGKEFINQDDHGRELQSASSFDGLGECLNPTEAGSDTDGPGSSSTSELIGYLAQGNQLKTSTQMSYWLTANQDYSHPTQNEGRGCGNNPNIKKAQHTTNLSNDILYKQVTIGYSNISNVIEYLVTFHVAQPHSSAVFEALTGYMTKDFSTFWGYNTNSEDIQLLSSSAGEQGLPIILSTADKNFAMGVYSPDLPQAQFSSIGYGRFDFYQYNTMKWNAVYRQGSTPVGDYSFRQYVIIGNLNEVHAAMKKLHRQFYPKAVVVVPTPVVVVPVQPAPVVTVPQAPVVIVQPAPVVNITKQDNYRFYMGSTGEHFITANYLEGVNAGFTFEGVAFRSIVASAAVANTLKLYRCYESSVGKHFVSSSSNCEGHTQEGDLGQIYSSQISGSVPLYRFYNTVNKDRLVTSNYAEGIASGYRLDGILGYVM